MRRCEQEMGPSRVCRIGREDPCGQGEAPEAGHQQNLICLRPDARHGRAYALPPIFWEGCISPRVYPAHSLRGAPAPPHAPDAPVEGSRAVCIPCERCGACARAKKMERVEQASHPSISADLHFPRRDRRGQAARGLAHRISHDPVPRSCLAPAPAGRDRLSVTFSALPSAFAATPRLASALCCSEPRPAGITLLLDDVPARPAVCAVCGGWGAVGAEANSIIALAAVWAWTRRAREWLAAVGIAQAGDRKGPYGSRMQHPVAPSRTTSATAGRRACKYVRIQRVTA